MLHKVLTDVASPCVVVVTLLPAALDFCHQPSTAAIDLCVCNDKASDNTVIPYYVLMLSAICDLCAVKVQLRTTARHWLSKHR